MPSSLSSRSREQNYSLFITVSVLFAWVNPLDLISILQMSLRVVAMERLFQQEELIYTSFLLQGGQSYMEERMYHAQMEVTLFSKAIIWKLHIYAKLCHKKVLHVTTGEDLQPSPTLASAMPASMYDLATMNSTETKMWYELHKSNSMHNTSDCHTMKWKVEKQKKKEKVKKADAKADTDLDLDLDSNTDK
ncbi:hypothetical protein DFH29DRAFT_995198 [Suillus ampliporus]|nr:hypothetical protein DFH29DRAFT_995198 [Suillus ampliporus]